MLQLKRSRVDLIEIMCAGGARTLMQAAGRAAGALERKAPVDVVEWIEANLVISEAMSPRRSGAMRLSKVQARILRAWQQEGVERIALPKPPRLGMSTCFAAAMLYMACHEGDDVLYTERQDDAAQTFYKDILRRNLNAHGFRQLTEIDIGRDGLYRLREGAVDDWSDNRLSSSASAWASGSNSR